MTRQKYNIICHTNPRLSCTKIQLNKQYYSGLSSTMVAKNDFSLLPDFSSSQQTHTAPIWAETGFSLHYNAKVHCWKEVTPNLEWKWTINSKAGVLCQPWRLKVLQPAEMSPALHCRTLSWIWPIRAWLGYFHWVGYLTLFNNGNYNLPHIIEGL